MSERLKARRALLCALTTGATAAIVASLGGSAAGGPAPECPNRTLCVWSDDNNTGQVVKIKGDGISNKLAEKMNNNASSAYNNTNHRAYLYDKRNGKGDRFCLDPNSWVISVGPGFNDRASSSKNTKKDGFCPLADSL